MPYLLIIGALTGFIVAGFEKVTGKKPASNVTPISSLSLNRVFDGHRSGIFVRNRLLPQSVAANFYPLRASPSC